MFQARTTVPHTARVVFGTATTSGDGIWAAVVDIPFNVDPHGLCH